MQCDVAAVAAVQENAAELLWGWAVGKSLTLADAPGCTLHLMYNALSQFMPYFEARFPFPVASFFVCLTAHACCPQRFFVAKCRAFPDCKKNVF
jgi:hypothetical protein